jgi:hypothetical protein
MDHAITIGEVLMASGVVMGVIVLGTVAVSVLWFMAQGWDH